MTGKIFRSTVLVAAVVLLSSLVCIMGCLYDYFDASQTVQLKEELNVAVIGTEQGGIGFLSRLNANRSRLTWVAADGTVLYDTHADAAQMENHADREEIREALKTGTGEAAHNADFEQTEPGPVGFRIGAVLWGILKFCPYCGSEKQ